LAAPHEKPFQNGAGGATDKGEEAGAEADVSAYLAVLAVGDRDLDA